MLKSIYWKGEQNRKCTGEVSSSSTAFLVGSYNVVSDLVLHYLSMFNKRDVRIKRVEIHGS